MGAAAASPGAALLTFGQCGSLLHYVWRGIPGSAAKPGGVCDVRPKAWVRLARTHFFSWSPDCIFSASRGRALSSNSSSTDMIPCADGGQERTPMKVHLRFLRHAARLQETLHQDGWELGRESDESLFARHPEVAASALHAAGFIALGY